MEVKAKIKKRRGEGQSAAEHRIRENCFLDGLEETVKWMSASVIAMLDEHVDDLNSSTAEFRSGMYKCLRRLLSMTAQKQEKVVFFHEAIPGFTVLAIKKEGWGMPAASKPATSKQEALKAPPAPPADTAEDLDQARQEAVQAIIETYVSRTGNRVLAIEGADVVLVMFPVSDLKKNLQEMGFWWSH